MPTPETDLSPGGWGRNLTAARNEQGVTQLELATRLGAHPVTINRWESGARTPSLDDQRRIAEALGRSVTELFPRTGDEAELPELVARLGAGCS